MARHREESNFLHRHGLKSSCQIPAVIQFLFSFCCCGWDEPMKRFECIGASTSQQSPNEKRKKKTPKRSKVHSLNVCIFFRVSGCQLIKVHRRRSFGRRFQPLLVMLLDGETIGKRMKHLRKRGIAFYSVSPVLWSFEKKDNVNMVWKNKREKRRDWNE
jgi:hypothetical protein